MELVSGSLIRRCSAPFHRVREQIHVRFREEAVRCGRPQWARSELGRKGGRKGTGGFRGGAEDKRT
jgi:hypothetical protein